METSFELRTELRGLKNDKLMTERAIETEKAKWAEMLKGSIGQDMDDVLSGKKKVKLSFKERFRNRWRKFLNIFRKKRQDYTLIDPMYGIRNLNI